jgi:hypothetical protein
VYVKLFSEVIDILTSTKEGLTLLVFLDFNQEKQAVGT